MTIEVHTLDALRTHLRAGTLQHVVVQGLDLHSMSAELATTSADGAVFLGCAMDEATTAHIQATGGVLFPQLDGLPYHPFRPRLYTVEELMAGYQRGQPGSFFTDTLDSRIYRHSQAHRTATGPDSVIETLGQRLHDHAIDDALDDLLHDGDRQVVGVMGGHAMQRDDPDFLSVARLAQRLAQGGLFVATGGGPGAMEAANLGAWLAPSSDTQLEEAVAILAEAPSYSHDGWFETAYTVRERFPGGGESLAVPTWFYGHEPSNLFSTHIAKYFANSIREDGLLAIATRGVVYAPGSAGTIQEVFMDAAQNHYGTCTVVSPMVFFGREYWQETKPVYPLVQQLAAGRQYADLLAISDSADEIARFILDNPPVPYKDRH